MYERNKIVGIIYPNSDMGEHRDVVKGNILISD